MSDSAGNGGLASYGLYICLHSGLYHVFGYCIYINIYVCVYVHMCCNTVSQKCFGGPFLLQLPHS